jgi:hypothetical protein
VADDDVSTPQPDQKEEAEFLARLERMQRGEKLPFPKTWEEYRDAFLTWLTHHWGGPKDRPCPVCDGHDWGAAEVLELRTSGTWPIPADSEHGVYPMGQVVCGSCGYTLLINVLFIFDGPEET